MHYICTVCRCFGNCSIGTPPSFPPALRETRNKKKKKKKKKNIRFAHVLCLLVLYIL